MADRRPGSESPRARSRTVGAGSRAAGRVILSDCRLVDGAGNPWVAADVLVEGDLLAAIAPAGTMPRRGRPAPVVVDAGGRFVTPGFIDPHTHSDLTVLTTPGAESAVHQGVTTHVVGNCGMSAAPVDEGRMSDFVTMWESYFEVPTVTWRTFGGYLDAVETGGCAINVAALVGHGALRIAVMGFDERPASARELAAMKRLLAAGMAEGAFGLSSGLVYPPGCYSYDRGADRARAGRQVLRRPVRHARARRARDDRRGGRRGRAHRSRVRGSGRGLAQRAQVGRAGRPARTSP